MLKQKKQRTYFGGFTALEILAIALQACCLFAGGWFLLVVAFCM